MSWQDDGDYDMFIDDDGKGEAADVVTIKLVGDAAAPSRIDVEFYHCKYSQAAAAKPVCGSIRGDTLLAVVTLCWQIRGRCCRKGTEVAG